MTNRQIPNVPCPGGTLYTIQPGDSYFGLARRFNTTVAALTSANPGVNPQNLQVGQQVCIPVPPTGGVCPGGFLYIIRSGDTYFSISRRFGIVVPALIAANPGVDPNRLFIGQTICVPATVPATCPGGVTYVIVAGDTLYSIARRYNISIEALFAANPGINPQALRIGQVICLPR
ncbi:MAG: LysM peptidoglycan-binding domain-containing protein [Carboxydocellales bacterium]